jgi:hypothetical protein
MGNIFRNPGILYEVEIKFVLQALDAKGGIIDLGAILKNGRGSYLMFQAIASHYAGLSGGTEGKGSDLVEEDSGDGYEVKSYRDPENHPKMDEVHCGPSGVFANNSGAAPYKKCLKEGDYKGALKICFEKGYGKNDYYLFTNTAGYAPGQKYFRYLIIHRNDLVRIVEKEDPAKVSRAVLLGTAKRKQKIA